MPGPAAESSRDAQTLALRTFHPLLIELSRVTFWQWLVAVLVAVVAAMIVSNARYVRRRRAWDRLRASEPRIRE